MGRGHVTSLVIDPADLPIVAAFDAQVGARRTEQAAREDAEYFTFAVSRRLVAKRRDMATIAAVVEWAGELPPNEPPETFDLRAHVLLASRPPATD